MRVFAALTKAEEKRILSVFYCLEPDPCCLEPKDVKGLAICGFFSKYFFCWGGKILREHNLRGFSALTKTERKRILSFFLIVHGSPKTRTQRFQVFVKLRKTDRKFILSVVSQESNQDSV